MATNLTMTSGIRTCTIPNDFVDEFEAEPFQNTGPMEFFHRTFLRYGYSTNILDLMEGNEMQQQDYMKGVLAGSISILVLVVIWMVLLIVFRAMGPYQVGILSGRSRPIRKGTDIARASKQLRFYRMIVVFCAVSVVVSSILMSINGIDSLTSSLQEGREGISIVKDLTRGGMDIVDRVLVQNEETGIIVEELLRDVNGICPNVRDPLCPNLDDLTTCNFEGIIDTQAVASVVNHFRGSDRNVIYTELHKARTDLEGLLAIAENIDSKASDFNWALYLAMIFSLCLAAVSVVIAVCIITGTPKFFRCLRSWILIPTFTLFVVLSFVFCLTFLIGTTIIADMCVDSPDPRIQALLNRFKEELSPILVEFATFYINQCPRNQLPREIGEQVMYIQDGIALISEFTATLIQESSTGGLQVICGFDEPNRVSVLAEQTNRNLCNVVSVMETIRQYFQCSNFYPVYETTVYDAICYDGLEGVTWVATTQFLVVFFAMMILTLRGTFYDLEIVEMVEIADDDSDDTPKVTISPSDDEGFELSPSHK